MLSWLKKLLPQGVPQYSDSWGTPDEILLLSRMDELEQRLKACERQTETTRKKVYRLPADEPEVPALPEPAAPTWPSPYDQQKAKG